MRYLGYALVIVSMCLIALSIGAHAPSYTILTDREAVAYVGSNNPSAMIGITVDNPVRVDEGRTLQDCRLFTIKNNIAEPMYLISVQPMASKRTGYNLNLSFYPGPHSFGSENGVYADIEGLKEGIYVETYEIAVCWGKNAQSASAVTHLYNIKVTIAVVNQTRQLANP